MTDMGRRKSPADRIAELSDEECKAVFDRNILTSENVKEFKYDLVGEEVDIRLNEPWVKGMKKKMKKHDDKLFRKLFKAFEKIKTIQIAVYLGHLCNYTGRKHKDDV